MRPGRQITMMRVSIIFFTIFLTLEVKSAEKINYTKYSSEIFEEEGESSEEYFSDESSKEINFLNNKQNTAPASPHALFCSAQDYELLKDNLLIYYRDGQQYGILENIHEEKFSSSNSSESSRKNAKKKRRKTHKKLNSESDGKDYLLSLIFSYFDLNNDGNLEFHELENVGKEQKLERLSLGCTLVDFLVFDDGDGDSRLSLNEFISSFNKLYSVSVVTLDKALEVQNYTPLLGENIHLSCSITQSPPTPIIWRRFGVELQKLTAHKLQKVDKNGVLVLENIQFFHGGNYSCEAQSNDKVVQTHIISVRALPEVEVYPQIIWAKTGDEVMLECRVTGEPSPSVHWLKNDEPIREEGSEKFTTSSPDGAKLRIKKLTFSDTGAYMCVAENEAGKTTNITSLVVTDDAVKSDESDSSNFLVFHEWGISLYDPSNCRFINQIHSTDIIPGSQDSVCGPTHSKCIWGSSLKAGPYIYVSQPTLDRLLIISISSLIIVDVVPTDHAPSNLFYVKGVDQVWVETSPHPPFKILQVVKGGGAKGKHRAVHPEPIRGRFDSVARVFVPPTESDIKYAYVTHKNVRGVYKMDLERLEYISSIDLTEYNCYPQTIQFSKYYGMLIVECFEPVTLRESGRLIIDILSDSVVHYSEKRYGKPYLSPDSRKLVTLLHSPDGTTLLLELLKPDGLKFFFDVKTSLNLSEVVFFPSRYSQTYDVYATATPHPSLLFIDTESGKVEMVSGVGESLDKSSRGEKIVPIAASGDKFSKYLATLSYSTLSVINASSQTVNCQIGILAHPTLLLSL